MVIPEWVRQSADPFGDLFDHPSNVGRYEPGRLGPYQQEIVNRRKKYGRILPTPSRIHRLNSHSILPGWNPEPDLTFQQ
jgi:hypothetical protein